MLPRCSFKAVRFGAGQINMWVKVSKQCGVNYITLGKYVNCRGKRFLVKITKQKRCFWCFVYFFYQYIQPEVTSSSAVSRINTI